MQTNPVHPISNAIHTPLSEKAMLVSLTIRMPSNSKQDKEASDEVSSNHDTKEGLARVNKSLFDKEAVKGFRSAAADARKVIYDMTLPWTQKGVKILLAENYFKLVEKIDVIKAAFLAGSRSFIDRYEDLVEQSLRDLGSLGKREDYPTREEIEAAFEFDLKFSPLSEASDWRVQLGAAEEERIKQQMMDTHMRAVQKAQAEPWQRVLEAVQALAERLEERSRQEDEGTEGRKTPIKEALIDNLVDLVDLLPGLNIADDPKINTVARDIKTMLTGVTTEGLKGSVPLQRKVAENARKLEEKVAQWGGLL